jgi:hypothetical protein
LWAMQLIYAGTFLVIVFLTVYWVMFNWLDNREKPHTDLGSRTFAHYGRIEAK